MKDKDCAYCTQTELLDDFGIYICDLEVSTLILFKEQSKIGRCVVAYNNHVGEIIDLNEKQRNMFISDVVRASRAIHATFKPDKVNYGAYGDTGCHLHMHIVPKYKDSDEWGGVFQMNPNKKFLSRKEYQDLIDKILSNLS